MNLLSANSLTLFHRFGADGSLKDWWSNATAAEFRSRAECLVSWVQLSY